MRNALGVVQRDVEALELNPLVPASIKGFVDDVYFLLAEMVQRIEKLEQKNG